MVPDERWKPEWAKVVQGGIFKGWLRASAETQKAPFFPLPTSGLERSSPTYPGLLFLTTPASPNSPLNSNMASAGKAKRKGTSRIQRLQHFLGKSRCSHKTFLCMQKWSAKPGFLIRTVRAWGRRAHALSSPSLTGKWGYILREGLRSWVVQTTMQRYSCASSYEWTQTMAVLSQKVEIQLHHLLYFSYMLLTYSGSNACLIPQKANATY